MKKITLGARLLGTSVIMNIIMGIWILICAILQVVTSYSYFSHLSIGPAVIITVLNLMAIPEYRRYLIEKTKVNDS